MRSSCDALVLRVSDYGENDKLLTVLSAEEGRCTVIAKGARSIKSALLPLCRPFTYANIEYYEKNGMRWLSGGSSTNAFLSLGGELDALALASYICELACEISGENTECERVMRMTLNTLYAIDAGLKELSLIKAAYEIFAAEESGFSPDMSGCCACRASDCEDGFWLDVMNGRVMCAMCRTKISSAAFKNANEGVVQTNILCPLDNNSLAAWRYIASADIKRIFAFSLGDEKSRELLTRATEVYILNHLERGFNTLDFYNKIKD